MSKLFQNRGAALNIALSSLALGILIVIGVMTTTSSSQSAEQQTSPIIARELRTYMHELGIKPESLAAAGIDAAQASSITQTLKATLDQQIDQLRTLEATIRQQADQLRAAERAIRQGAASAQDIQACNTLRSQHDTNVSQRQSILDAAYTSAVAALTDAQRTMLARITNNSQQWTLPTRYLTLEQDEQSWLMLRDALSAAKAQQRYNLEPDETLMAHKLDCDAQLSVIQAKQSIENTCDAIESAINSAI